MAHHHHEHHAHAPHDHAGHAHGHSHAPADFGRAFAIGIALNAAFVLIEGGYGIFSHSMALVADAGHNLSDVLGLVVAWVAFMLVKRKPTSKFTYGLGSSSILAALFNAIFLLVAVGVIGWEAILRLITPQPVEGMTVMVVAGIGIVVNGATALLFMKGQSHDLNIKGAYLHMLADAGVSVGVVAAGGLILLTGWLWIDPIISLMIAGMIIWTTWGLLRDSLHMSLSAAPGHVDVEKIRAFLQAQKGVTEVHDLHVWPLSTTQTALTCHLVMPKGGNDEFLHHIVHELEEDFAIGHVTVQVETSRQHFCHDCGA